MSTTSDTIRVVIPLTMKRRNGRPRILPPEEIDVLADGSVRDPRLLEPSRAPGTGGGDWIAGRSRRSRTSPSPRA